MPTMNAEYRHQELQCHSHMQIEEMIDHAVVLIGYNMQHIPIFNKLIDCCEGKKQTNERNQTTEMVIQQQS